MKISKYKSNSEHYNLLLNIIEHDMNLYSLDNYTPLYKYSLEEQTGNYGVIKAFVYSSSLRFKLIFDNAIEYQTLLDLTKLINQTCVENIKNKILLWYSQINNNLQCNELFKLMSIKGDPYFFTEYTISRDLIKKEINLKGLSCKLYSDDMIDDCIDILESAFTPFLDAPGSFIREKDWLNKSFQTTDKARCEVFFYGDKAIGLYSHNDGMIEYVAVKKEYQNNGFGSIILAKAFNSIFINSGSSPYLCSGDENTRAHRFYERAGMRKVCNSVRIEIHQGDYHGCK